MSPLELTQSTELRSLAGLVAEPFWDRKGALGLGEPERELRALADPAPSEPKPHPRVPVLAPKADRQPRLENILGRDLLSGLGQINHRLGEVLPRLDRAHGLGLSKELRARIEIVEQGFPSIRL